MKFLWTLILLFSSQMGLACASNLKFFSTECALTDQYNEVLEDYAHENLNPLQLKVTILPIIYGENAFKLDKYNIIHLDQNASSKNNNQIYPQLFSHIKNLNPTILTLENILEIHKKISTVNPGKLRSYFGITRPVYAFRCLSNSLTKNELNQMIEFDVLDDESMPMISINNIKKCEDGNFAADIQYLKGAKVKSELEHWLIDFNDALNRYERNELAIAPYKYLAVMMRHFEAIHPFNEKNEEVAYYLNYYATNRLNLSPQFIDTKKMLFLNSKDQVYEEIMQSSKEKISHFKNCLFEIIDTHVSEECLKF